MRNVKCSDCDEYRNEWCEKVIDSPHPDLVRDCQYWHERKDRDDCISRQAAIDAFDCAELTPDGGVDANEALEIDDKYADMKGERNE